MAKAQRGDRIAAVIRDVETVAKRLRADLRKRATAAGLPKDLQTAAAQLRKRAAAAAAQVERYVHEIRKELEGTRARPAGRRTARKPAPRRSPRARSRR